ncbi:MAG: 3'-5' exoribonuclease YhaM family protein [Candidatus Dojkabacteria bacterium]
MKDTFVKDLRSGGAMTGLVLGLSEFREAQDKNGNTYWDLVLQDKTGQIKAKVWGEKVQEHSGLNPEPGKIYELDVVIGEYRGELQLTVNRIKELAEAEANLSDFVASSEIPRDEVAVRLEKYITKITDPELKKIIQSFWDKYKLKFLKWPAAQRNHHQYLGGLSDHTLEMLDIASSILPHYPRANKDLVYAGIFLHDSGKMLELQINGFSVLYTTQGRLKGHIVLGLELLNDLIANELDEYPGFSDSRKYLILSHIILAHHGKVEYGSPVPPQTLESAIVAKSDVLSNDARIFNRVIAEHEGLDADFTPKREFTVENVYVYLPSTND